MFMQESEREKRSKNDILCCLISQQWSHVCREKKGKELDIFSFSFILNQLHSVKDFNKKEKEHMQI